MALLIRQKWPAKVHLISSQQYLYIFCSLNILVEICRLIHSSLKLLNPTLKHRYIIELSYSGKNFHGWQIQANAITVQQYLQESISTILQEEISLTGAGRTDTGVHASYYVAHFDSDDELDTESLVFKLNQFLSKDLSIYSIRKTDNEFHARFGAINRSYKYIINTRKSVFLNNLTYYYSGNLDIDKMNRCSALLMKYSDFTSFAKLHSDNKTNICKIGKAVWESRVTI